MSRLDEHAREMLRELGSKHSKELAFRDNWIFVGGQTLAKPYEGVSSYWFVRNCSLFLKVTLKS